MAFPFSPALARSRFLGGFVGHAVYRGDLARCERDFLRPFAGEGRPKTGIVNDVPAHAGDVVEHLILGRLDSMENILDDRITALVDHALPRDVASGITHGETGGVQARPRAQGAHCRHRCPRPARHRRKPRPGSEGIETSQGRPRPL